MRRVLVFGGRKFSDKEMLFGVLDRAHARDPFSTVISGGAPGADDLGELWAIKNGVITERYPAEWADLSHLNAVIKTRRDGTKYDALAGHRRNQKMLEDGKPDIGVAFPGGTGTEDMIQRLKRAGVQVVTVRHNGRVERA